MREPLASLARVGPPMLLAVLLRCVLVLVFPEMPLQGDEVDFYTSARDVLAGREATHFPFRPPLYIGFCAAVMSVTGPSPDGIRFAQAALEGLAVLGVFLLVRRTLGQTAATWAAWLWALFPDFVTYSHTLWSESVSLCLLVWGVLALVLLGERPGVVRAILAGLLWGALALIKAHHLYLLPLLLGWLVLCAEAPRGRTLKGGALALLVAALVIVPWSVRQSRVYGKPIVICTTGAKNLESGVNYAPPPQFDYASRWNARDDERRTGRQREVSVVAFILERPQLFLRRAWQKMSYLWSPNSFFVRHLYSDVGDGATYKYGAPDRMDPALRRGAVWLTIGANGLLTLAFLLGIWLSRERRLTGLAAIYCLATMAMITLTPSMTRYRLPMMAFAVCFAAAFLANDLDLRRAGRRRLVGLGLSLLLLLAWWAMRVPDLAEAVW